MKNNLIASLVIATMLISCSPKPDFSSVSYQDIKEGFIAPAPDNELWCYYYWINDDISKEGITKDLEAMKEVGIATVLIGNINPDGKDGTVPLFSDEWWDLTVHTVNEGKRIGVDVGFFNCPGWSQSGGPWVQHDKAMRYIVYKDAVVEGGGKVEVKIEQPADEFQDVKVLAVPFKEFKSTSNVKTVITCNPKVENAMNWFDNDTSTFAVFDEQKESYDIDIQLNEEIAAKCIVLTPANHALRCDCELYAELDGEEKLVKSFHFNRFNMRDVVGPVIRGQVSEVFKEVKADRFKLVCKNISGRSRFSDARRYAGFAEILITEEVFLEDFVEKQMGKMHPTPAPTWYSYLWEKQVEFGEPIATENVIDISDKMGADGNLTWDAPEGKWRIIRFGMTPTGVKNHPAAPQGRGYEVDKMSAEIAAYHFDNFIGEIYKRVPEENRSALKYVIADSYETGSQNWTDGFKERFESKFGYDPEKFLPVYCGIIIESVEQSNRFFNDMRRMVADDIAYEYVGGLKKAANKYGLKLWLENYGHWGFPSEFLLYGGQTDLVGGEFWTHKYEEGIECLAAASAAHIYGKPKVYAESFTASGSAYLRHPASLKKFGDWSYTTGVNAVVLHVYIQQPDENRVPGVNAWFGTEFNRHNTWFELSKYWNDYQRRCMHLLQQGQNVADVCYFIGENAPVMTGVREPELPEGYKFDYINAEVILNRLDVKDGKFVLPEGTSYELMVLPPSETMTPELLNKLEELIDKGGRVLGPKLTKSPSLKNYPQCDEEVKKLADNIWGDEYTSGKLDKTHGNGFVMNEMSIDEVFDKFAIEKDVQLNTEKEVLWIHRSLPGMQIYFLSNQTDDVIEFEPSFRVSGLKPQLWNAVSGEILAIPDYTESDSRTSVELKMKPAQSWFVVFTDGGDFDMLPAVNFGEAQTIKTIDTEWTIDFSDKKRGPENELEVENLFDWSISEDNLIKYYSGTATYSTTFTLDEIPEGNIYINLGKVHELAEIKLNGELLGGVWMAPYALPVQDNLKQGENKLEIKVANLWRNRMIFEKPLPEDEKTLWWLVDDIKNDEALHPSGLLGPVTLER